jgi:hypothetical protein
MARTSRQNLAFSGPLRSDHDAAMRIGGEAPGRSSILVTAWSQGLLRVTATSDRHRLVALHGDFDGLIIGRNQLWKIGRIDAESDGACGAWLSCDEAGLFER